MITSAAPASFARGRAAAKIALGLVALLVPLVLLAGEGEAPKTKATPLDQVTPGSVLVELPAGCDDLEGNALSAVISLAVHAYIASLPMPSTPSNDRSRLWLGGGASAILHEQSMVSLSVGKVTSAVCWPGEGVAGYTAAAARKASAPKAGKADVTAPDDAHPAANWPPSLAPLSGSLGEGTSEVGSAIGSGAGALGSGAQQLRDGLGEGAGRLDASVAASADAASRLVDSASASARAGVAETLERLVGKVFIVRLYGIQAQVTMRYTLEETLVTKLLLGGSGGGTIEAKVEGLLLFDDMWAAHPSSPQLTPPAQPNSSAQQLCPTAQQLSPTA